MGYVVLLSMSLADLSIQSLSPPDERVTFLEVLFHFCSLWTKLICISDLERKPKMSLMTLNFSSLAINVCLILAASKVSEVH